MFKFEHKIILQWLWALPVLILLSWWGLKRAQRKLAKGFGSRLVPFLTSSVSQSKRKWKWVLQAICLAMLIFAWARPQAGQSKQEIRSEGVEVIFVVDVSESMLADDLRPSRLEQAKVDIGKLIDLLNGNKIGLIAFAGSAGLLSPMTNDPSSLKLFTESLSVSSVSSQGTNFRAAMEEAKGAFDRGGSGSDSVKHVSRAIILLSDGEDHEPGAQEAAQHLAEEGTFIYAIAYGTQKGAPIPQRDSLGYLKGYKKDHKGNTILTTVNGDELRSLAEAGRGTFYFASAGSDYLPRLVEDLNKLEKTQFEAQMAVQYDEKFQVFLFLSWLFGLIELVLGERRGSFRLWKGRFEVPPA